MLREQLELAVAFAASSGDAAAFVERFQARHRELQYGDEPVDEDPAWDVCIEINSSCDWYNSAPGNRAPPDLDDAQLRAEVARHLREFAAR